MTTENIIAPIQPPSWKLPSMRPQEQAATEAQAAELTRQYQAQMAALHEQYETRHAERTAALAEVRSFCDHEGHLFNTL